MATKYRRLTYRDYDSSRMLTELNHSIQFAWRQMHSWRKIAKKESTVLNRCFAQSWRMQLNTLLAIRREARES